MGYFSLVFFTWLEPWASAELFSEGGNILRSGRVILPLSVNSGYRGESAWRWLIKPDEQMSPIDSHVTVVIGARSSPLHTLLDHTGEITWPDWNSLKIG